MTIIAKDKEDAIEVAKEHGDFIYPYERTKKDIYKKEYIAKWHVELFLEDVGNKERGVIDTHEDSDY